MVRPVSTPFLRTFSSSSRSTSSSSTSYGPTGATSSTSPPSSRLASASSGYQPTGTWCAHHHRRRRHRRRQHHHHHHTTTTTIPRVTISATHAKQSATTLHMRRIPVHAGPHPEPLSAPACPAPPLVTLKHLLGDEVVAMWQAALVISVRALELRVWSESCGIDIKRQVLD